MTLEEIKDRVEKIRAERYDDESAHADEDELREDFIEYIASLEGVDGQLSEKAHAVLSTNDIKFSRWYA